MGQNILDTDGFTGTPGQYLHAYNANWIKTLTTVNEIEIPTLGSTVGIAVDTSSSGMNYRTGFTWTNDQFAQLTLDSSTAAILTWVGVRLNTSGVDSGYYAGPYTTDNATHYVIEKMASGTNTVLAAGTATITLGDIINLEVVGTTLTLRVNGTIDATVTDTTYSSGNPGIRLFNNGFQNTPLAGSWKAGSVTSNVTVAQLAPAFSQGMSQPWYSTYV